jgi:hypothetical protein
MPVIIRFGGGAASTGLPEFTYTGTYTLIDDGNKNWRIKFLTSGTLTPLKDMTIDVFLVGGGSSGKKTTYSGYNMAGGAGGYTRTVNSIVLLANSSYQIVIGAGGQRITSGAGPNAGGYKGGDTSAFSYVAFGGDGGAVASTRDNDGGFGGSGGGASGKGSSTANGGSDGANGSSASFGNGGTGQGTSTREFGEATGDLYAGGGGSYGASGGPGGGANGGQDAMANTGGGGGGGTSGNAAGAGGSGIVVIRNHRAA